MVKSKQKQDNSMDLLQQSLLEIENDSQIKKQSKRISKITKIPKVFVDLEYHENGKKGQSNAIIQALTSIIIEKGGDTIPVSYFSLLLSSLPGSINNNEELDNLLYLFRLILPEISSGILLLKFNDISLILQNILTKKYEISLIIVNTLKCIHIIMQSISSIITVKSWKKQAKLVSLFHSLLALSIDPRSKIRKESQLIIESMYDHNNGYTTGINSSKIIGKFIISQLHSDNSKEDKKKTISYIITMIIPFIYKLPVSIVNEILTEILQQMNENSNYIRTQGYNLFNSIFTSNSNIINEAFISHYLPEIECIKPQEQDYLSIKGYCEVISNSMIVLHKINGVITHTKIPSIIKLLMNLVLLTKYECYESIFSSMEQMIKEIIDDTMIQNTIDNPNSNLYQLSEELRSGLSFQYKSSWGFILALYIPFFEQLNSNCIHAVSSSIHSIEEFAKDSTAKYHSIALQALSEAVRSLGTDQILQILPLRFDLPLESPERREWLLPALQKAIIGSKLETFGKNILPLIQLLKKQIEQAENDNNSIQEKHYKVLHTQLWELLPSFCRYPTDIQENFKNIAKLIGTLLNEQPELRIILCKSLTTLILKNRSLISSIEDEYYINDNENENENDSFTTIKHINSKYPKNITITEEQAKENLKEIGKYAKNFFPILFNIFCSLDNPTLTLRSSLYNTIKAFAFASDDNTLNSFFNSVLKKILTTNGTSKQERYKKAVLTELSKAFIEVAAMEQLELLYKIIKPQLGDNNIKIQKKSYQVLERLCCNKQYLSSHLDELKLVLISNLSTSKAAAKKNRLRCLRYVIHALPGDPIEQLFNTNSNISSSEVLAEIIVCVKEINKDAREEAFQLLIKLCERSYEYYNDSSKFIQLIVAGLAGTSSHMISATIQSLTRLVHHMRDLLDPNFVESLYQTILILFTTKNREIVKSCLGFVKTCCFILTEDKLKTNIKTTIDNIFLWINESKNRFRSKIKLILQKFIIKLGYEEIQKLVPNEHHKLLASIRRDIIRKEKQNPKDKLLKNKENTKDKIKNEQQMDISDDSDNDNMDSDDEFIEQFRMEPGDNSDDEEILDLLDPSSSKQLKYKKKESSIINEDDITQDKQGRFVIKDINQDENEEIPPTKSIHEIVHEKGGSLAPTRGKRSRLVDLDEDDEIEQPPKKRQKITKKDTKYSGKEYKNSKASGDVKVSGRYEPFAYMAMNPQLLNKRKQQKVRKQYQNVISSAKKGATKGKKASRRK